MSLNISCYSDSSEGIAGKSLNGLLKSGKISFKEVEGKLNFQFNEINDLFCGTVHCTDLLVFVDNKPWGRVILLPKETTLAFTLKYIGLYGELTKNVIFGDPNFCLGLNILHHVGSFKAVLEYKSL